MKTQINIIVAFLTLTLLFACEPNGKEQTTDDKNQVDATGEAALKNVSEPQQNGSLEKDSLGNKISEETPQYYICYTSDSGPAMAISISFDKNEKALKVKYKGQESSMTLSFLKENFIEGGAHPTIETFYTEIYDGKENGVYKLSHSGVWDYAEYTRSKDGKKFNFTINHELSIENDGYRTTPCF